MWPYDIASTLALVAAAAALGAAAMRRLPTALRLSLILAVALVLRVDASYQQGLHDWDERFHAVVAKNLIAHPLVPTLYERPASEAPPDDWTEAHVWLHKPPLSMWLMAGSMAVFGVDELPMRLPSVLLSTLGVWMTFWIGRRLYDTRVGLGAAAFQAVNGLLINLASGRRVADHVDTTLITCVGAGVLLLVCTAGTSSPAWKSFWPGLIIGAGVLAKSFPALVVLPVGLALWTAHGTMTRSVRQASWCLVGAAIVAMPWTIYTYSMFSAEANRATAYTLLHITQVVEGHGGAWWTYLADMPRYYGELIVIPVVWFLLRLRRRSRDVPDRVVATWLIIPYGVFSAMATKLPGFVAMAAPALFLVQALFWCDFHGRLSAWRGWQKSLGLLFLGLLTILPARQLLEPTGPLERRDRHPPSVAALRGLEQTIGLADAVIFNLPEAIDVMFYTRYTAYTRMPRPDEIETLRQRGVPIVIAVQPGEHPDIPASWNARVLRLEFRPIVRRIP